MTRSTNPLIIIIIIIVVIIIIIIIIIIIKFFQWPDALAVTQPTVSKH